MSNQQRSRSRQKMNQYNRSSQRQQSYRSSQRQQRQQSQNRGFQRGSSNERRGPQQRPQYLSTHQLQPQQPYQQAYQPPATLQQQQFRKSSSPNRMGHQSQQLQQPQQQPQHPSRSLSPRNIPPQNLYTQTLPTRPQQTLFNKETLNSKKLQTLEDLATFLRTSKKPFPSSQAFTLQSILQRMLTKHHFQQIYQVFLYYFIHSSSLDENLYKVFYSLIATAHSNGQQQAHHQVNNPEYIGRFYDSLIRATLKSAFEEFKAKYKEIEESVKEENYFMTCQKVREQIMNRSLYYTKEAPLFGCSIRNTLTLVRKVMEREKSVGDRSNTHIDEIHPIRHVLKVLKNITKSILNRVFTAKPSTESKQPAQSQATKQKQNTFHLLLISQLSLIIHFKYKHHIQKEFQQTLNEMTILKMKMAEVGQQVMNPMTNTGSKLTWQEQKLLTSDLKLTYQNLHQQHQKNYMYLLFVLNLSTYNSTIISSSSFIFQQQECDMALFGFYVEPLIIEYAKSSEFLEEKIRQNLKNSERREFFESILKNNGVKDQEEEERSLYTEGKKGSGKSRSLFDRFALESHTNILLKTIDFQMLNVGTQPKAQSLTSQQKPQGSPTYIDPALFFKVFNSLSPIKTSFSKINMHEQVRHRVKSLIGSLNKTQQYQESSSHYQMNEQQQVSQSPSQLQEKNHTYHAEREFSFLVDHWLQVLESQLIQEKNKMAEVVKYTAKLFTTSKFSALKQAINETALLKAEKSRAENGFSKIDNGQKHQQHKECRKVNTTKPIKPPNQITSWLKNHTYESHNSPTIPILTFYLQKTSKYKSVTQSLTKINNIFKDLIQILQKGQQNDNKIIGEIEEEKRSQKMKNNDKAQELVEELGKLVNLVEGCGKLELQIVEVMKEHINQAHRPPSQVSPFKRVQSILSSLIQQSSIGQIQHKQASILSLISQTIRQQQSHQSLKFLEVMKGQRKQAQIDNQPNRLGSSMLSTLPCKSSLILSELKNDALNDSGDSPSYSSIISDLIKPLMANTKKYIQLIHTHLTTQHIDPPLMTSSHNFHSLQQKLTEKKLTLIREQLLNKDLCRILNQVTHAYAQIINNGNTDLVNEGVLFVQSILETLFLNLFMIYRSFQSGKYQERPLLGTISGKKGSMRSNIGLTQHNQMQKFISKAANLNLSTNSNIPSSQHNDHQERFSESIESLLSQILCQTYNHLMTPFRQLKESFVQQSESTQPSTSSQSALKKTSPTITQLEQILIRKLKKSIALFYDNINQTMINHFILKRRLFILRCLVVTFYKIKALSDAFVFEFGVFSKLQGGFKNGKVEEFCRKVFFTVKDGEMLENYVWFLMTKERVFLKGELQEMIRKKLLGVSGNVQVIQRQEKELNKKEDQNRIEVEQDQDQLNGQKIKGIKSLQQLINIL